MKKLTRLSALIMGAVIAVSSVSALTSEAIWDERYAGVLTDLYAPPEGYETFEDSELYQNYSEYFDYGAMCFRSVEDRQFFAAYYYFEFSHLELTVTDTTGWEEIYNKYSDELDMDSAKLLGDDKTVRIMDWVNCGSEVYDDVDAEIQKRYDNIPLKYDKLMDMCAEMYDAGVIESAWYAPFSGISFPLQAISFSVKNYDGTADDLKAALADVCPDVTIKEYSGSLGVILNYDGASAEDYFACIEAVKALDGAEIINDDIIVTEEIGGTGAPALGGGSIDVIQMIQDESAKVYFDGDLFAEKDGFIQFDDTESMFDWETWGGDYLTYLNENRNNVYVYSSYTYNETTFTVVRDKLAAFQALYNKYNDQLQMDYYNHENLAESNTATVLNADIHDIYNDMGEETLDPTEMENKRALIGEMAREMYRAGYIIDAEYSSAQRSVDIIDFDGIYISYPEEITEYASEEELTAIIAPWNGVVKNYDTSDGSCNITCSILDGSDAVAAIRETCPDAEVHAYYSSDEMARFESSDKVNLLFENKFSDDTDDRTGLVSIDESELVSELSSDESEYEYITSYSDGSAPWKWGVHETDIYLVHYYDKAPDISGIEGAELLDHADYLNAPDYKLTGGRGISRVSDTSIMVKGATAEELASLRYATMVCRVLEVYEKQCDPSEGDAGSVMVVAGKDVSEDQFLEVPGVISAEPAGECSESQQLFRVKFQSAVTDGDTAAIMAESYENCKVLLGYDYVDTAYPAAENDLEAEPTAYSYKAVLANTLQSEDVDGDGGVTLTDAIEALRIYAEYAAGIDTCYSDIMSADANNDGTVSLDDTAVVLTAYARKGAGLTQ